MARKSRLLDTRKHNYYFTEKEYERVKLEDDKKHAKAMSKIEEQLLETQKKAKEQLLEAQNKAAEQLLEAQKKAKEQQLETAVKFLQCGMDITLVSTIMNISISDIENHMAGGCEQLTNI